MATTSPDGIRSPNPTDPYNLVSDWAITTTDVQNTFNKRANMYVGTSAQRVAFSTAPEGTHWQDTDGTRGEYVRQSGAWVGGDTGWLSLGLAPGFTGSIRYRGRGDVVEVRADISGSITGDIALSSALPAWARPYDEGSSILPIPGYINPAAARSTGALYTNSSGILRGTSGGGTAITRVYGSVVWLRQL